PFQLGRRPAVAIRGFPPPELAELPRQGFPDLVLADTEPAQDVLVENEDTATRDRSHCELLVSWNAQFPDEEDIERRAELLRHFVGDRHTAARQREHDDAIAAGVVGEGACQDPPRLGAIPEPDSVGLIDDVRHRTLLVWCR